MYPHSNNNNKNLPSRKDKYPLEGSLHSMTEIMLSFMKTIMAEEQTKKLWKAMNCLVRLQGEEMMHRQKTRGDKEEIQYHSPYTDAFGQRFFIPQKLINNHVQGVEYDFSEDLDGDKLMNNLSWLGRGGDIMDLAHQQQEEDNDHDNKVEDEESLYPPP